MGIFLFSLPTSLFPLIILPPSQSIWSVFGSSVHTLVLYVCNSCVRLCAICFSVFIFVSICVSVPVFVYVWARVAIPRSVCACVRVCVICGGLVRLVIRFNQSRIFYTRQQFIPADITMQPNVLHWPHSTCPRKWWENTECVDVLINLTKGSYNLHTCFQLLLVQHLPLTVSGCT